MNIIKSSLSGLVLVLLGELVGANLVFAQEANHDFGIVQVNDSPTAAASGVATSGFSNGATISGGTTNSVSINGVDVALSPDVAQAIATQQGTTGDSVTGGSTTGESATGESSAGDSSSGNSSTGGVSNTVSFNDLATLIQNDLQESVDNLVAAESVENQTRRFARRRSSTNCNCAVGSDGKPKTVAQLQDEVDKKTAEAQKFVQQVNSLDPENNIW